MVLFEASFDGFFLCLVIVNDMPLWSEFASGGSTEQFSTTSLFDTRARSIRVALPLVFLEVLKTMIWLQNLSRYLPES